MSSQNNYLSSTGTIDRLKDSQDAPFALTNWTDTILFRKYENKESTNFEVSDQHFSFQDIVITLDKFKKDPNSYRKKEVVEPYYLKSLKSLELLMAETHPNDKKFQKI